MVLIRTQNFTYFLVCLAGKEGLQQKGKESWIGILIGHKGRQRFQMIIMIEIFPKSTFVRRQIYGHEKKNKVTKFFLLCPFKEAIPSIERLLGAN